MPDRISAPDFDALDLPDWRYLLGAIEASWRVGSFSAAAALVERIATAADAADHHPDVDVRYPDVVHVSLTTHAVDALTVRDVELASVISDLAAQAGATSEPLSSTRLEIAIDAIDIEAVRPFWQAVLDYVPALPRTPGAPVHAIVDPRRVGPAVWFQQMDEPRPQRNRIHIDVTVTHDAADARLAAALAAGGTLISDRRARAFWVLADAEGNEACICTWQDRG